MLSFLEDTRAEHYHRFWSKSNTKAGGTLTRNATFINQTAFINYYPNASLGRLQASVKYKTQETLLTMRI